MKRWFGKNKAVKDVIATVAPTVATALGGPLAGLAVRGIAGKLLGNEDADFGEVETAIAAASGADLVKLKELELEFKAELKDAGVELEKIASEDRDSARQRQVQMKDWTPSILGMLVIAGFFSALAYLIRYGLPGEGDELLLIMFGALAAMTAQVGNYFFGSSMGSKSKDVTIADLKGALK